MLPFDMISICTLRLVKRRGRCRLLCAFDFGHQTVCCFPSIELMPINFDHNMVCRSLAIRLVRWGQQHEGAGTCLIVGSCCYGRPFVSVASSIFR